jgi:signal transduction histidine kinase
MRIRTQLIISVILFGIALLIISASVYTTNQHVDQLNRQQELVNKIELGAGELGYLSNDYLLFQEPQQLDRWESRFSAFSNDLSSLTVDKPEQQVLVDNMKLSRQRLKEVFENVATTIERQKEISPGAIDTAYVQLSWSRVAVQNQGISFDASRLAQMLRDEENQVKQTNTLLISSLLGTFIVFLLIGYLLIYGRTIRSIVKLQNGTKIIGSGNLDYSIDIKKEDEIGELARAFNQMTAHLKNVTTSKTDLEKEIIERKRAEEELAEARAQAELYLDLMGHDINNMNQVGMGYLEVALETLKEDGRIEEKDIDLLEKPLQSIQDSTRLIDNVRKLRSTKSREHQLQAIDLKDVLLGVKEQFSKANGRHVTINYTPVEGHVLATGLVKDVFVNIVGNAIKHSDSDKPLEINITQLHIYGTDESYHKVIVEDNGPGIPDELKTRIFNRFERGYTKAKGKGLGLYLVKTLVHDFNGRIWVEDRVQGDHTKGARFVVMLPSAEK